MMWLVLLACKGTPTVGAPGEGLVGDHPLNPFPVGVLHMDNGRIALSAEDFDLPDDLTPMRTERFAWRTGFSPAQTSVVSLASVDPVALPGWREPTPGESGVRLLDRTTSTWLPVMAELDAHPEALPNTLLIRPLVALVPGHDIAVVLTTALTPVVPHFEALLGEAPPADLAEHVDHFEALLEELGSLGLPPSEVALAWDFPVGDGTAPLRSAWEQVAPDGTFDFLPARELDDGDDLPPRTYRATTGTFRSTDYLVDDLALQLGPEGGVTPVGTTDVELYVHLPESVADAPAGSVPVLLFGHGIFGTAERYLDDETDDSQLLALADDLGVIVVGIRWRGLTTPDLAGALNAANDFTRLHEVTDRLVQAQANMKALIRLLDDGTLLADPVFTGRSGQSLADSDRLLYYGISLGAIEGAVLLADDPPIEHAVLHVGGSAWSTMLERSSNWPIFESLLVPAVPDALTRQRLYAASQLWWDPVDPISYTVDLQERSFLLHEAIGDQQVPNLSTRVLARSVGLELMEPAAEQIVGVAVVWGPVPPGERTLVQVDPQVPLAPDVNRPAANNNAHEAPRDFPGVYRQTVDYLASGEVLHHCGTEVCSADNPGE